MTSGTKHTRSYELQDPRKRRRTTIACDECRERKRKCDGIKPVCGACSKRPLPHCVWDDERNSKGWDSSYVKSLRSRVKELEEAQRRHLATVENSLGSIDQANVPNCTGYHKLPVHRAIDSTAVENVVETQFNSAGDNHVCEAGAISSPPSTVSPRHIPRAERASVMSARCETRNVICEDNSPGADAMGAACSFPRDDTDTCPQHRSEYFGPSSAVNFLSKARRVMSQGGLSHNSHHSGVMHPDKAVPLSGFSSHESQFLGSSGCDNGDSIRGLSVPPRSEADALVESYWTWFHPLYPFIHQPSFNERYLAVWESKSSRSSNRLLELPRPTHCYRNIGDRLFHCLLNAVFALGSQSNPAIEERNRINTSLVFFERAKRLLDFDMFANGNLALVQTLLLMGQYLQSTDMSSACWNVVGMAIRVAQDIGLHHEPDRCDQTGSSKGPIGQAETELRRRVWAGCVLLDRVLSLAYGRPMMIRTIMSQNTFVPPCAIDDKFLTQYPDKPGSQPVDVISILECYVQAIKLQDIVAQVLTAFYYGDHGIRKGSPELDYDLQMALDFDSLLMSWHTSLPTHLKVHTYQQDDGLSGFSYGEQGPLFCRQANVLETRYLYTRLIMLRPALSIVCGLNKRQTKRPLDHHPTDSTMEGAMLLKAASLCISVAQELVHLITNTAGSDVNILPPPWYSVFYIHSCAMVILIGLLDTTKKAQFKNNPSTLDSWNRCLSFLRGYKTRSQSAQRYCRDLELAQREITCENGDNKLGGSNATCPEAYETVSGRDADVGLPRGDFPPFNTSLFSQNSQGDFAFDQLPGWMGDSTDMSWLSFAPFLEEAFSTNAI